jgi:endonuclease/exonuclease/phosphatase family metal-dependent hydrolase
LHRLLPRVITTPEPGETRGLHAPRRAGRWRSALLLPLVLATGCVPREPAAPPRQTPGPQQPAPHGASIAVARALRIASWNLNWLDRSIDAGVVKRSEADYQRLRQYAQRLDADIVAFQEVEGVEAAWRVFDPAKYDVHVSDECDSQRTGFAFKRTLSVTRNPDYVPLDVGSLRVGADITLHINGAPLRLLSIHLKSGCFKDPLERESEPCRKLKAQLPFLEAWIDARSREHIPAIILGDFNRRFFAKPDEPFWTEIDDADPPGSDLMSPTQGHRSDCWSGQYPVYIDHIVFNELAARWYSPNTFQQQLFDAADAEHKARLSDHCPISVTVTPAR